MLIVLDSNVFIAALSPQEAHSVVAQQLVSDSSAGRFTAVASSIAYGEILGIRNSDVKLDVADFFAHIDGLQTIPADDAICLQAAELRRQYGRKLKLPDALHLATAQLSGADKFITNDVILAEVARKVMPTVLLADWQG